MKFFLLQNKCFTTEINESKFDSSIWSEQDIEIYNVIIGMDRSRML